MSAPRVLAPIATSSSHIVLRLTVPTTQSLRPCQHVLRQFSSTESARMSSKRKMQTSTAYKPYTLTPPPPPPRNADIPDSSLTAGIPQVNDTRPPNLASQYGNFSNKPEAQRSPISLTEGEAQNSLPTTQNASATATTTAATPNTQPKARPRPKLRARKAAMKLTPGAVEQLRNMLNQPDPKLIKVGVRNRGCSGLAYHLEYVDKTGPFDEAVEQDGVKVLIDSKALFSIIGSEMDWVEDKLNQRFVFKNPNIKEQCGCGESFMV
ncbi:putative iron-sulfur cluster assembly accessory protein Isa1 [Xylogone sp. PMI_703]|nr:putative iron-sulfur cluster assembly accessory protein Isa1 [Xylogone sp. PMI_703]